jgi:hypothetical protein
LSDTMSSAIMKFKYINIIIDKIIKEL